ncbi:hypothetical protein SDC9_89774 [bioreactor metagenome]|uniref:Uncharacterized protein n=1 Tax=bioreactor metagenome TaxID=1076179 RepID=A0A644ZT78_9ZZZZ
MGDRPSGERNHRRSRKVLSGFLGWGVAEYVTHCHGCEALSFVNQGFPPFLQRGMPSGVPRHFLVKLMRNKNRKGREFYGSYLCRLAINSPAHYCNRARAYYKRGHLLPGNRYSLRNAYLYGRNRWQSCCRHA